MNQSSDLPIPFLCTDADGQLVVDTAPSAGWVVAMRSVPDQPVQLIFFEGPFTVAESWLTKSGYQLDNTTQPQLVRYVKPDASNPEVASVRPLEAGEPFRQ